MAYINVETNQYPISEFDIRQVNPNTSFCFPFIAPENYSLVFDAPKPEHNPTTQLVRELEPMLTSKGIYEQRWEVVELPPEIVLLNQQTKEAQEAKQVADKIEKLWKAADDYTSSYISGVAIGILAIGVLQGLPKALAVSAWSKSVWDEYYIRKSSITTLSEVNTDFSVFGEMPHSVPELSEELGMG